MTSANATPSLHYADILFDQQGTPESLLFDDIYFSRKDGVAESKYVFIEHNDLLQRFQNLSEHERFMIAETGFGSGLNFLLAADLFLHAAPKSARLHFTSFEKYPLKRTDLEKIVSFWPQFQELANLLMAHYPPLLPGLQRLQLHSQITLDLYFADVNEALPNWAHLNKRKVNAWFLDGFAPTKNPEMWQPYLFQHIAVSMANRGSLATFSATGNVRRSLTQAGLKIKKDKGFGRKREMLYGTIDKLGYAFPRQGKSIVILGDGIAAASLAYALKDSQKDITVISQASAVAAGASGNPQGAVYPLLQAQWTPASDFYSHAHEYARQLYKTAAPECWHETGVQQISRNSEQNSKIRKIICRELYPVSSWVPQTQAQASVSAGLNLPSASILMPTSGWVLAKNLVEQLFADVKKHRESIRKPFQQVFNCAVTSVQLLASEAYSSNTQKWVITCKNREFHADQVIIACGERSADLLPQSLVPIRPVRGQITQLQIPKEHPLSTIQQVICSGSYITPIYAGTLCIGATFDKSRQTSVIDKNDNMKNINQAEKDFAVALSESLIVNERASVRATTPDHLPLAGRAPYVVNNQLGEYPNLWILSGFGARGLTSAPLAAELVAAQVENRSLPVSNRILEALQPNRFAKRALLRNQPIWIR